jgi:hypothetical protein
MDSVMGNLSIGAVGARSYHTNKLTSSATSDAVPAANKKTSIEMSRCMIYLRRESIESIL